MAPPVYLVGEMLWPLSVTDLASPVRWRASLRVTNSHIIGEVKMAANNNSTTALSDDGESFLVPEEVRVSVAIILGLYVH